MDDHLTNWCRFISNHTRSLLYLIITVDLLLSSSLYFNSHLFEFSEPLRGFESRGGSLSNRINSWKLLSGKYHVVDHLTLYLRQAEKSHIDSPETSVSTHDDDEKEEDEKRRLAGLKVSQTGATRTQVSSNVPGFCGDISESYVQLVLEPNSDTFQSPSADLFSLDLIRATCQLDSKIRSLDYFTSNCVAREGESNCCQSWNLPNLILKAFNKSDCSEINNLHIRHIKELIDLCYKDYLEHRLTQDCSSDPRSCPDVPVKCYENGDLVFNLIHFILSADYVTKSKPFSTPLLHSNLFLPLAKSSQLMPFFHGLERVLSNIDDSSFITIGAYDLGLKEVIFEKLLVDDLRLLVFAFASVLVILLIFTSCFLATCLMVLNLLATLGGSLLIYRYVLGITFFPFMNLMSVIILIAVGGDSVFFIYRSWQIEFTDGPQQPMERLLKNLIHRTFMSTLFSSGTTSLALIATSVSQITSLKCFGIYSGIAVTLMYLLTMISLPVILSYRAGASNEFKHWIHMISDPLSGSSHRSASSSSSSSLTPPKLLTGRLCQVYKFFSIILMFSLTGVSLVFFLRGLQPPTSEHFSTLDEKHPFEKFDVKYRDLFKFSQRQADSESNNQGLPIKFVFGVEPTDTGSHLSPEERGSLTFDHQFDISHPRSQQWLLRFCQQLQNASFYQPAHGPLLSNCFIDTFRTVIAERKCYDDISEKSHRPCCNESTFPYSKVTFQQCLPSAMDLLYHTPTYTISRDGPGVLFWRENSTVATLVVQHNTNYSLSNSYSATKKTLESLQMWLDSVAKDAPDGLKSLWYITDHLELFALQDSLITGTYTSVMLALLLAFIAFILTTRNILLTLFATVTTSAIIVSTLSTLIHWFNWEINVVESVVFSMAIGISVDLPLHLIISYQRNAMVNLCNQTWITCRELFPPLMAACSTTAIGGFWMTLSHILAYQRMGTFLVTISSFNLLFTLLLLPGLLLTLEQSSLFSAHQSSQSEFLGRADLALSNTSSPLGRSSSQEGGYSFTEECEK